MKLNSVKEGNSMDIKKLSGMLAVAFLFVSPSKAQDIFTATLIDHVMTVTQIKNGETDLALVDSIIQIGKINGGSILDLQAGFGTTVTPDAGDPTGANLLVGGFFKVSSFMKGYVKYPDQWKFLNSIEHGPVYFWDFREKRDFVGYQIGLAFGLNPKN